MLLPDHPRLLDGIREVIGSLGGSPEEMLSDVQSGAPGREAFVSRYGEELTRELESELGA